MNKISKYPKPESGKIEDRKVEETSPTVCLILPFNPKMTSKHTIAGAINRVYNNVDEAWSVRYQYQVYHSVLKKLRNVLSNLNYNTHKKSICLFVSASEERIYYLNMEIRGEAMIMDQPFDIRNIVKGRAVEEEYLVMLLKDDCTSIYLNNFSLNARMIYDLPAYPYGKGYLREVDNGLAVLKRHHPLPLFVFGTLEMIDTFKKTSSHSGTIFRYVEVEDLHFTIDKTTGFLTQYFPEWDIVNHWHILSRMVEAHSSGKIAVGIPAINRIVNRHNHCLLLMDKNFTCPAVIGDYDKETSPLRDMADDLIEKVLVNGGDVHFSEDPLPPFILF